MTFLFVDKISCKRVEARVKDFTIRGIVLRPWRMTELYKRSYCQKKSS